jgi:hypothetical protein
MSNLAAIFFFSMLSVSAYAVQPGQIQLVQDSAHTLLQPNAPDPGRSGQIVQLPQGGIGITTGGTSNYQTLSMPGGGSALMFPNGGGMSTVIGSSGMSGTVSTPR